MNKLMNLVMMMWVSSRGGVDGRPALLAAVGDKLCTYLVRVYLCQGVKAKRSRDRSGSAYWIQLSGLLSGEGGELFTFGGIMQ